MTASEFYEGREQSLVKHLILQHYLERFAYIIGRHWRSISYIDCFAGSWKSRSEEYDDTSFAIAIRELTRARAELTKGNDPNVKLQALRAFFLELNSTAYAELQHFASKVSDVQIQTKNASLEDSISDIQKFVREGGTSRSCSSIRLGGPVSLSTSYGHYCNCNPAKC